MPGSDEKPSTEEKITVLCGDCGKVIELDARAYILAVHLLESCPATADLRHE